MAFALSPVHRLAFALALVLVLVTGCRTHYIGSIDESDDGTGQLDATGSSCEPCRSIYDVAGVTGDPRADRFFALIVQAHARIMMVREDFRARLTMIADDFTYDGPVTLASADVRALVQHVRAELTMLAPAAGQGVGVYASPVTCTGDRSAAHAAQIECEVHFGCAPLDCASQLAPTGWRCDGTCRDQCAGACEGAVACTQQAGACPGRCMGTCELSVATSCEGICGGSCDGPACGGACAGQCGDGECWDPGEACDGICHGPCVAPIEPSGCSGEVICAGACDAECGPTCEGWATPAESYPRCGGAGCEQAAACAEIATLVGAFALACDPITVQFGSTTTAGMVGIVDLPAPAAALRDHAAILLQSYAEIVALTRGTVDDRVAWIPTPFDRLEVDLPLDPTGTDLPCVECFADAIREVQDLLEDIESAVVEIHDAGSALQATLLDPETC